jgi:alpha-L-fucosidase
MNPKESPMIRKTLACLLGMALASGAQAQDTQVPHYAQKLAARLGEVDRTVAQGPFKDDWDSLSAYRVPGWFRDAKFGIFIHWGVYSVPGFANEWYSRNMYVRGNAAYTYHRNVWGPQDKFGYKDFIPKFRAEKFDPKAWVELFARAGARYVVPVAEHCDGFAMYDSDFSEWDAAKMGPHRDVVGDIAKATRAKGLHFGLSSHRAEHWWWYNDGRAYPSDVSDPRYQGLYGPAASRRLPADANDTGEPDPSQLQNWLPPSQAFVDDWLARSTELVDKYKPELIYLDWWTSAPSFEPDLRKLAAYYYDRSKQWGQGPALAYKGFNFPPAAALFDIERGKLDALRLSPWQTDTSVSVHSWGYAQDDEYRTADSLVKDLVDVVSKNGNLLLNVGPRADGTIPEEAQKVLLQMGAWLDVNGEAIYDSRPWKYYGEGPTRSATGEKTEQVAKHWTPQDIRFTTHDDMLYAIGLARPHDGEVLIKTLYRDSPYMTQAPLDVQLLGAREPVRWRQDATGLHVTIPVSADPMPYTLRIHMAKPATAVAMASATRAN